MRCDAPRGDPHEVARLFSPRNLLGKDLSRGPDDGLCNGFCDSLCGGLLSDLPDGLGAGFCDGFYDGLRQRVCDRFWRFVVTIDDHFGIVFI